MRDGRTPLIAGNWKMHKTVAEAEAFIGALLPRVSTADGVDVAVCPPFTALGATVDSTRGSRVEVYAQTMHHADSGAYTGEVAPAMLAELDVHGVILGHSERRGLFGESDRELQLKVPRALEAGLKPILCVGETEAEREAGETEDVLSRQVALLEAHEQLVLAYEPVWAIGTGKTATPDQAQEAHAFLRSQIDVPILYGGSVKPDNAGELLAQPDVDGALVGGASLDVASFAAICKAAAP
jgi:triosephosphate isomerase (TIM)